MTDRENTRRKKLLEYFKSNLEKGYNPDSLKWALIKQGNSRTDVLLALEQAQAEMKKPEVEKPAMTEIIEETRPLFVESKPWWKFW
ncbi:MAG: hypothetical protein AABX93_00030 [Nanoarchaeota archaeon]